MAKSIEIGNFVIDTLQIYFSWDDDLYTELKSKGFGKGKSKTLPLIYTDNTEITTNQPERRRKYVIRPEYFGKTYSELGWKPTEKPNEPIIPAEKPLVNVSVIDLENEPKLKFTVIPTVNYKEQYHLEYSAMSSFGKLYSNWVGVYLSPQNFIEILNRIKDALKIAIPPIIEKEVKTESKQNQREEMDYIELPIVSFKFCLAGFKYMIDFFENNGVNKDNLPCLFFHSDDPKITRIITPFIKLGIVHTKEDHGFEARKPQTVMKVAQDKISLSKRGKKAKMKGVLIYEKEHENYIIVNVRTFVLYAEKLLQRFRQKHGNI